MNNRDPYLGNILTQGLGSILSPEDVSKKLLCLPAIPTDIKNVPVHIRMHYLMQLRDMFIPSLEATRMHATIDLLVRPSYRYRDPLSAETWRLVGGELGTKLPPRAPASAAVTTGLSGSGKTESILRSLNLYPQQTIHHASFPQMANGHTQVVWLSTDVPASGRVADMATNLMLAWDILMGGNRFAETLKKTSRKGPQMMNEWCQVASAHFLGILHLDEVQNFFKIQSLERRKKRKSGEGGYELSIVEDDCLKAILNLTNLWQIPIMFSGTPDGVGALTKRLSTTQRLTTGGYHPIMHFEDAKERRFLEVFFKSLCRYQYVRTPLPLTEAFAELIIELTGGIPRIIMALWISAHRVAFERKSDDLRIEDFTKAAATYLALVGPAVHALRSKDPERMSRFEDLIPRDDGFWSSVWNPVV